MSDPVSGIALAVVIVGLALSTLVTRTSFLVAGARLRLTRRAEVALRYAPVCTLAAIIAPDVFFHGGVAPDLSPLNPRLLGVLAAGAWLCWSRNIVGCLATGMAAYTLARLYL
jgi:branched-subunit amino acid transport protein